MGARTGGSNDTAPYFRLVFGATLLLQLPMILALRGVVGGPRDRFGTLALLGVFTPAAVGMLLAYRERRLGELLRGLDPRRASLPACALAFVLPGTIVYVGMVVLRTVTHPGPTWWPPAAAEQLAGMALFPLIDQIGWRGYAYPRLRARHGVIAATLLVGLAWPAWHVFKHAFLGTALPVAIWPLQVLYFGAATVFYSWLYERTEGSLLVVVLAQMGAYMNNPFGTLPADPTPLAVSAVVHAVLAIPLLRSLATSSARERPALQSV